MLCSIVSVSLYYCIVLCRVVSIVIYFVSLCIFFFMSNCNSLFMNYPQLIELLRLQLSINYMCISIASLPCRPSIIMLLSYFDFVYLGSFGTSNRVFFCMKTDLYNVKVRRQYTLEGCDTSLY